MKIKIEELIKIIDELDKMEYHTRLGIIQYVSVSSLKRKIEEHLKNVSKMSDNQ